MNDTSEEKPEVWVEHEVSHGTHYMRLHMRWSTGEVALAGVGDTAIEATRNLAGHFRVAANAALKGGL